MLVVGLTGGIASGKSTVLKMLGELGARTFSADDASKEVVLPGRPAYNAIVERLGAQYVKPDGSLDRAAIAGLIFRDPQARAILEEITHPAIKERIRQWVEAGKQQNVGNAVLVVETPLLYEAGMEQWYDRVVVVYAPDKMQTERLSKRDGLTYEEARRRVASQMPIEEKRTKADWVVENTSTERRLQKAVEKMWSEAVTLSQARSFNSQPE